MGIENDLAGAGKAVVDEAALDAPKALDEISPELKALADHFVGALKDMLVGRKVTVTIE